jgi:hypothetical protein
LSGLSSTFISVNRSVERIFIIFVHCKFIIFSQAINQENSKNFQDRKNTRASFAIYFPQLKHHRVIARVAARTSGTRRGSNIFTSLTYRIERTKGFPTKRNSNRALEAANVIESRDNEISSSEIRARSQEFPRIRSA